MQMKFNLSVAKSGEMNYTIGVLESEEKKLKTHDFYYDLPEELIAQTPLEQRDSSRLMVLNRETGEIAHKHFYDVIDYLNPGDCLVLNDSRVLPARLMGHRPTGGAAAAGFGEQAVGMPVQARAQNAGGRHRNLRGR